MSYKGVCHFSLDIHYDKMRFSIILLHVISAGRQMIPKRKSATCLDDPDICTVKEECTLGTYGVYQCTCRKGYSLVNNSCEDVNECTKETHACHPSAECKNINGSYYCVCKQGMEMNGIACSGVCLKLFLIQFETSVRKSKMKTQKRH